MNNQAAACWTVLSKNETYAYTANAANNTISGYRIAMDGSLTVLTSTRLTATADDHPLDMAVTKDGCFMYALNTGSKTIVGFRAGEAGGLTRVGSVGDLPAAGDGLGAR